MRDMIEAAVIVPLFLFVFVICVNCLFFNHDRNVLGASVYETLAVGSGRKDLNQEEIEAYFKERVEGRFFYKADMGIKVETNEEKVEITSKFWKSGMEMWRTNPEEYIRSIRKLEKINEKLGEEE